MVRTLNASVNGTARTTPSARKAPRKAHAARYSTRQRMALAVGTVGAAVLALSVWDVTAALSALTGMPVVLAALLAIGIDCGMVCCEGAAVLSAPSSEAKRWADRYIGAAVGLSVLLNGFAAAQHAQGAAIYLAAAVGGCVPLLVYGLGRVAGALWTGR